MRAPAASDPRSVSPSRPSRPQQDLIAGDRRAPPAPVPPAPAPHAGHSSQDAYSRPLDNSIGGRDSRDAYSRPDPIPVRDAKDASALRIKCTVSGEFDRTSVGGPEAKHIMGVNPQFLLRARMPTKIAIHLKLNRRATKVGLILLRATNRVMILDDDITLDAFMGSGDSATLEYSVRDQDRDHLVLLPLATEEASFSLTILSEVRVEVEPIPEVQPPPAPASRAPAGFDANAEVLQPVGQNLSSVYNSGYRVELPPADPRADDYRQQALQGVQQQQRGHSYAPPAVHSLPEPGGGHGGPRPHEAHPQPQPHGDASAIARMEAEIRQLREVVFKQSELIGDLAKSLKHSDASGGGGGEQSRRWFKGSGGNRTAPSSEGHERHEHEREHSREHSRDRGHDRDGHGGGHGHHGHHSKNEDSRHGNETPAPSSKGGSKACVIS
eukprot:tig00000197_g15690.t1